MKQLRGEEVRIALLEMVSTFKKLATDYRDGKIEKDALMEEARELWTHISLMENPALSVALHQSFDVLEAVIEQVDKIRSLKGLRSDEEMRKHFVRFFYGNEFDLFDENIPVTTRWYYATAMAQGANAIH
jgi:hypothetical protein